MSTYAGRLLTPLTAFGLLLIVLVPIAHTHRVDAEATYDRARHIFMRGHLEESQRAAEQGYRELQGYDPEWAARFQLLNAEILVRRGLADEALHLLEAHDLALRSPQDIIRKLTIESIALSKLQQLPLADQRLKDAEVLCKEARDIVCGEVKRARGVLEVSLNDLPRAQLALLDALATAKARGDRYLEATVALDLGWLALQNERFDESVDWSTIAYQDSKTLGAEDLAENISGNLGWAYFGLGDLDRALELFTDAEQRAAELGNIRYQVLWLTTAANVYQQKGDFTRATQALTQALALARSINSKEDIVDSLEDLAHTSVDAGKLDTADRYIQQVDPLVRATGNRLDILDVQFAQARVAAARRQDQQAEDLFRSVERDPDSQTSMRLGAEHELARLYEAQGNTALADRMYRASLGTFETARAELKNEDSKLPFLANATGVYDDYIHFLVQHGKTNEALAAADQSRARTLAQGLGVPNSVRIGSSGFQPGSVARKMNATLLFYWLGRTQSYLWAITPTETQLIPLPAESEIIPFVARYRKTLLGLGDPIGNADGAALYKTLIAPAAHLIKPASTVVILSDGPLNQLNFETLIVPGATPHYWIEDATLISAPSLYLLASAKPPAQSGGKLLLIGDAVSPGQDYPELPMAASEMHEIEQRFPAKDELVLSRERATPAAYIDHTPQQFSYIHFVAHGVASSTDPLDSAIILSPSGQSDSFKLYARDIIQRPIHARLVTVSACYGTGTRTFAGEGSVGLAWAFLRAGAHNVIGALWEVSDTSTPRLMGDLYQGIQSGLSPGAALRQAKLTLLHSKSEFRKPFYWAPLQVYTGL